MRDRGIDILVDLNGYFGRARPGYSRYRPARSRSTISASPARSAPLRRLHRRRRARDSARARGLLHREGRAPARHLPGQRPRTRGSRSGRPPAPRPACRRRASSSAASTTTTRSRRRCSTSGCACCAQVGAACCGCWSDNAAAVGNLRREAERRGIAADGWCSRRARRAGRASRAPPAGGPLPRHPAVQRAHDGERRALGGAAAADLRRQHLSRPRRGEPARRGRPARARHAQPRGLRSAGARSRALAAEARGDPARRSRATALRARCSTASGFAAISRRLRDDVGTAAAGRAAGGVRRAADRLSLSAAARAARRATCRRRAR